MTIHTIILQPKLCICANVVFNCLVFLCAILSGIPFFVPYIFFGCKTVHLSTITPIYFNEMGFSVPKTIPKDRSRFWEVVSECKMDSRVFELFWNARCFGIVLECKIDLDLRLFCNAR